MSFMVVGFPMPGGDTYGVPIVQSAAGATELAITSFGDGGVDVGDVVQIGPVASLADAIAVSDRELVFFWGSGNRISIETNDNGKAIRATIDTLEDFYRNFDETSINNSFMVIGYPNGTNYGSPMFQSADESTELVSASKSLSSIDMGKLVLLGPVSTLADATVVSSEELVFFHKSGNRIACEVSNGKIVRAVIDTTIDTAASGYTLTVEEHAVDIVGSMTTYRLYVNMVNEDDFLSSVYGNNEHPLSINTVHGFYNDIYGSSVASGINPAFFGFFPTLEADSWMTIGIDSQNIDEEVAISTVEDSEQKFVHAFKEGSAIDGKNIELNTQTGGAWYVMNNTPNGLPDANGRVLIMQLTTVTGGGLSGTLPVQIFENGDGSYDLRKTFEFDGTGTFNAVGEQ